MLTTSKTHEMNFDEIFQKIIELIENRDRIDMDCVFRHLAIAKHGTATNKKGKQLSLSNKEAEIFCLSLTFYSELEQSFIREHSRRMNQEEFNTYIDILQDSSINFNQARSARNYRDKLKQDIIKTKFLVERKQIAIKLRIASSAAKVFDNRAFYAREIKPLLSTVLGIYTLPPLQMIMRLLQEKYPLN